MNSDALPLDLVAMQKMVDRSPYNRFLGIQVVSVGEDGLVLAMDWRPDLVSSPELQSMHGGVLAAMLDAACDYALGARLGRAVPTIDLRIDYHRIAGAGSYEARSRIVHLGRTLGCAEATVVDAQGRPVASARGQYLVQR